MHPTSSLHLTGRTDFCGWRTAGSSQTLANIYHDTRHHIPEDMIFIFTTVSTSNLTPMNDDQVPNGICKSEPKAVYMEVT
jgi:hypothetical protein